MTSPSPTLAKWRRFQRVPGGTRLFSAIIGFMVPYTGTIGPRIDEVEPGYARTSFRDRRKVRNHLKSVHAIAMINLAELTCSLALSSVQPKTGRWIVTGMTIEYVKKARGRISAECRAPKVDWTKNEEHVGEVVLKDSHGDVVAVAHTKWKTGPTEA